MPEGHIRRHEQPSNIFSPFQEDPIAHLKMCSPSDFRVKNVGSRNSSCSSLDANVTLWRASRRLPGTPIRGLDGCHHHVRRPCSPTLAPKKLAAKSQKQQMLPNISASVRGNAAAFEPAASRGSLKMGVFAFRRKKQDSPFQPKVEIPFPVVAGEVEYITIEAKHRGRGRCFRRAMNFLDCLGKRIFYGGHS